MDAASNMVRKIGDAIYLLDITIQEWSEQLDRAQPHRKGRLVVVFGKHRSVRIEGEVIFDISPAVGRMHHFKAGGWSFRKLTPSVRYKHLRDLRVGSALKSDAVVVRLIDGIEEMLAERDALCGLLASLSRSMSGRLSGVMANCARRSAEAIEISKRIKIDWSKGAAEAEETIKAARRARYARSKAKKAALA